MYKAEILYLLKRYNEAKITNKGVYNLALEIDNKDLIFSSRVLDNKINFMLSKKYSDITDNR